MLTQLAFTNFKSWPEARLTLAPITGLLGTNSSGKTSILQFLLLLKQTKDATDRALSLELNGSFVQLGTIRDAIQRHDEARSLDFELAFRLEHPLALQDPNGRKKPASARMGAAASAAQPSRPMASRRRRAFGTTPAIEGGSVTIRGIWCESQALGESAHQIKGQWWAARPLGRERPA